jgi:catechol 2,3-dioxygenase-like lactoylglutathione lyase family enzyme
MPDFSVTATNHTSFTVSDLSRSLAFFRDALGFQVTSEAPRAIPMGERITGVPGADLLVAYVQGPGHRLELIEYRAPADRGQVRSRPCDTGFAHIAFDVDDIEAAISAAASHGVTPVAETVTIDKGPNAGGKAVYLRDPDGITIEFIQPPPL